jgi:hypothetical protein
MVLDFCCLLGLVQWFEIGFCACCVSVMSPRSLRLLLDQIVILLTSVDPQLLPLLAVELLHLKASNLLPLLLSVIASLLRRALVLLDACSEVLLPRWLPRVRCRVAQ